MLAGLEGCSVVASRRKGGETSSAVVSAGTSSEKKAIIAVVAAMMLHFVAFGAMVGTTVVDLLIREEEPEEEKKEQLAPRSGLPAPRDMLVELNAADLLAMREELAGQEEFPEPVAESPAEPEDRAEPLPLEPTGFAGTSPEQESEQAPEEAVLIGERNTRAASELAPVKEEGPELPTQDGEETRRNVSLFDSDFSPGEQEGRADPANVEEQTAAGDPETSVEEPAEAQEATRPVESVAKEGMPKDDLLETGNTVEVPVTEGQAEEEEETLPKEQDSEREASLARQGEGGESEQSIKEQVREGGFRTESRKTRVEGTISRQGKSSFDVEATAVGRYKARVNRLIETEWQRLCVVHRDHLHPGILTLRFYVDKRGRVTGLRYLDVVRASEMQKGFTMQSVRQPRLPVMPGEVARELEDEPLEFRINFKF